MRKPSAESQGQKQQILHTVPCQQAGPNLFQRTLSTQQLLRAARFEPYQLNRSSAAVAAIKADFLTEEKKDTGYSNSRDDVGDMTVDSNYYYSQ